jgi:membrane protease YdiL (CAAX protease family)
MTIAIFVLSALAIPAAIWLGVFRPRSIDGPLRIDRRRPVWPLVLIWGAGTVIWLGVQTVLVFALIAARHPDFLRHGGEPPQTAQIEEMLSPGDWAVIALVPAIAGFACMLIGGLIWNRSAMSWLGFDLKKMPQGVLTGAGATLLILPWMFLVMLAAQWLYERTGYQHPHEHELLREMNTASPLAKIGLIIGATVGAPFFEELLFRGHLQTILRQTFIRMTHRRDTPPLQGFPVGPPAPWPQPGPYAGGPFPPAPYGPALYPPPPPYPATPYPPGMAFPPAMPPGQGASIPYLPVPVPQDLPPLADTHRRPYAWQTWLAVFLTSIVFMLIHVQPWMFPPIFCLSICLGYVYERTGNLWANITIHALFNTSSTIIYLLTRGHG